MGDLHIRPIGRSAVLSADPRLA